MLHAQIMRNFSFPDNQYVYVQWFVDDCQMTCFSNKTYFISIL